MKLLFISLSFLIMILSAHRFPLSGVGTASGKESLSETIDLLLSETVGTPIPVPTLGTTSDTKAGTPQTGSYTPFETDETKGIQIVPKEVQGACQKLDGWHLLSV